MSMIGWLLAVLSAQSDVLQATPALASALAAAAQDDHHAALLNDLRQRLSPEQWERLDAQRHDLFEASPMVKEARAQVAEARKRVAPLGSIEPALDLEKSWHLLHYLFTGYVGPADAPGDTLLRGEELGEDVGHGPPRLHSPNDTRAFHQFLENLSVMQLQARLDLEAMRHLGIYAIPMGAEAESEVRG